MLPATPRWGGSRKAQGQPSPSSRGLPAQERCPAPAPCGHSVLLFPCAVCLPGFPYEKVVQRVLYLQVLDYDRFSRNDPIGEVSIPLNKVDLTQMQTFWKDLKPCSDGSVRPHLRVLAGRLADPGPVLVPSQAQGIGKVMGGVGQGRWAGLTEQFPPTISGEAGL